MIAETIVLLASLSGQLAGAPARAGLEALAASAGLSDPVFQPARREVNNWRGQSWRHLDLDRAGALRILNEPERLPRCIRLNNYWCIKSAGWKGEIASDGEGHVAFSSALEGAATAALLLRRYYITYGRKSAHAIVSRWAPVQCGGPVVAGSGRKPTAAANALAVKGIQNTLRGRYLARNKGATGRRVARGKAVPRRSTVATSTKPMMRAPSIIVGFSEKPSAPTRLAGLTLNIAIPRQALASGGSCPSENARVRNYAARASAGVAGPGDDLRLFDETGAPTENLARVMENMAAVEIGPLAADPALIRAGIARAVELWTPPPQPDPAGTPE
ncbi:MAG: uncharacterized protein JWL93_777 [Hyphomicrobiales bacterium]|nr:uncharacterized protein [Hyphomicrobiales bacterium]